MEQKNQGFLFSQRNQISVDWDDIPLKEYPRTTFRRDSYFCLNGKWDLLITKEDVLPSSYSSSVMVPYAVESPLSGVNHLLEPDEFLFYHKHVVLPQGFEEDETWIHFEGVDQSATVYIDETPVMSHVGGYTPFSVLLPKEKKEFDLIVKVRDVTDSSYHSRGKQVLKPTGWFYSSSSGIIKPVWMESVKKTYVSEVKITPDYDKKNIKVLVSSQSDGIAKVLLEQKTYEVKTNQETELPLMEFYPWNLEDPYLYDVEVKLDEDVVHTYFGIRKIEVREKEGQKRIYLNEKPVFFSGILDQGYYYLGNLTPRSYQDYLDDILLCKKMGFNCIRVHVKVECDLFYRYADENGILLIQDFPCGGTPYGFIPTVIPRVLTFLSKEKYVTYKKLSRLDKEGRDEFEEEAKTYLKLLLPHPSIVIYTIFNEGWGEFDPSRIYHECKEIDPTRLYDTASGWYDADSDFYSIHTYTIPDMKRRDKKKRPFIISEMGGISLKEEDHSYFEGCFGHGKAKDEEELTKMIGILYLAKMKPQIRSLGLNMLIYTQLADCETEYNGLMTYDRQKLKVDAEKMRQFNEEIYHEFDAVLKGEN